MLQAEQVAWAAGLFEGEGTVYLFLHKNGRQYAYARLSMTDFDIVERFAALMPFGSVYTKKGPKIAAHHKPQLTWSVGGERAVARLAMLFWPYLGERRKHQFAECLEADHRPMANRLNAQV